jgi:EAL domain-containing protein (putative c-di-GMP-specific phosphodiesterase class I)
MERRERDRLQLERDLRGAVDDGGLRLAFQPIVDTQTDRVMAAEALVRWVDPARGDVEPGAFVPLAEETGLILRIGRWALREACRSAASWPDGAHGAAPGVSVNVSTRQLSDPGLVAEVADALHATGLPPSRLGIEITETAAVEDELTTLERLTALRALGVRCILDDFGTGWSSLAWLQRLPVQTLKVDRSFVAGLAHGGRDRAIVDATLQLARALGLQTVAEGVETAEQRAILEELGCDRLQGFFIARPLTSEELLARLRAEAAAPARRL